jgi:hypothetical protein
MKPMDHPEDGNNHSFNRRSDTLGTLWVLEGMDHLQILENKHTVQQTSE